MNEPEQQQPGADSPTQPQTVIPVRSSHRNGLTHIDVPDDAARPPAARPDPIQEVPDGV